MAAKGSINPDILINQGHVLLAKAQYVQAAKLYERSSQFYFNQNENVMLYKRERSMRTVTWKKRVRFFAKR